MINLYLPEKIHEIQRSSTQVLYHRPAGDHLFGLLWRSSQSHRGGISGGKSVRFHHGLRLASPTFKRVLLSCSGNQKMQRAWWHKLYPSCKVEVVSGLVQKWGTPSYTQLQRFIIIIIIMHYSPLFTIINHHHSKHNFGILWVVSDVWANPSDDAPSDGPTVRRSQNPGIQRISHAEVWTVGKKVSG